VDNFSIKVDVSRTFRRRLIGQHLSEASRDLVTRSTPVLQDLVQGPREHGLLRRKFRNLNTPSWHASVLSVRGVMFGGLLSRYPSSLPAYEMRVTLVCLWATVSDLNLVSILFRLQHGKAKICTENVKKFRRLWGPASRYPTRCRNIEK